MQTNFMNMSLQEMAPKKLLAKTARKDATMESQNSKGDGTYLLKMNENAKNESKSVQWKHGAAVKRDSRKLVGDLSFGEEMG